MSKVGTMAAMHSRTTRLLVAVATLALSSAARADGKDAGQRATQAQAACLSGDYAKGVSILAELYVGTRDAIYIFNQGRCFEQNGKYEEAIVRFREYQVKVQRAGRGADPEAEKHIATCQEVLDKQKPAAPAVTAPAPVIPPAPAPAPEPRAPEATTPTVPQPESDSTREPAQPDGFGLRVAGIATAAVGLGGIATGLILNLKANKLSDDLEAARASSETLYDRGKESKRSSYETWGWVAYGAGAACLAGGAVLYLLGYRQADTQVAFVPMFADGHAGATLQGAF